MPSRVRRAGIPRAAAVVFAVLVLGACGGDGALAPVAEPGATGPGGIPLSHTVRRGESVYAVAFRYGVDPDAIIDANGLSRPFRVFPGQRLRLTRPKRVEAAPRSGARSAPAKPAPRVAGGRKPQAEKPAPDSAPAPKSAARKPRLPAVEKNRPNVSGPAIAGLKWQWPAAGRLVTRFGEGGAKGIDIAGKKNQPILAVAPGQVVYSGSGLIGYGMLVIVKHDDQFLSAYAHNEAVAVQEGDAVKAGQQIAAMGSTGTDVVKLHFEIRRNGKPVDPLSYLPPRG